MREGDDTHPFGIVASGRVALRLLVPERGATTILTVEPGDVLGWSALVPPCRATSTAVAVEPTRLVEFEVDAPSRAARGPGPGGSRLPRVLEAVARRLGATRHQLLDLYARETTSRGDGRSGASRIPAPAELDRLLTLLQEDGRTVIGPIARMAPSSTTRCDRPRSCRGLDR